MKGKSRKILILTWPVKSFFDGQPSAFTRNFFSPSQPCCRSSLTRRSSAPYKLSCRLAVYGSICASSGLTAISGRAGGIPLGQALFSGYNHICCSPPPAGAKTIRLLPSLADRVRLQAPLAYAARLVSLLSSYSPPLFHTDNVTAASFRAIVSRAISALIPFSVILM
jgi:hypothetical protein